MAKGRKIKRSYGKEKKEVITAYEKSLTIALAHQEIDLRYLGKNIVALSRKFNVRLGRTRSLFVCRKCGTILIPGRNGRFRLHRRGSMSYLGIKCLFCGEYRKVVIKE
ncbi:MAG: ribonuclease P Rpr2/Rpp21/SNM1 subunit [Fervidicoccaceae archaeon]|jgi:RNase P subunit RPR2